MTRHEEYRVEEGQAGQRLDVFLAEASGQTRARIATLIKEGRVALEGVLVGKAGLALRAGQRVRLEIPEAVPLQAQAQDLPLRIVYEDEALAVVDKPAGLVVHPGAGNPEGTLVNALLFHLDSLSGIGGVQRPGIVHRLDKDTSGLLLVAKDDAAHLSLSRQLAERGMEKTYAALALGRFPQERGRIEAPIARDPKDRKRMAVVPGGREALTTFSVVEPFAACALLQVLIHTGRTHQIRVHLRSIGHPVVGDPIYGPAKAQVAAPRLMLHAARLCFDHPRTGQRLCLEAAFPADFAEVLERQRKALEPGYEAPPFFG